MPDGPWPQAPEAVTATVGVFLPDHAAAAALDIGADATLVADLIDSPPTSGIGSNARIVLDGQISELAAEPRRIRLVGDPEPTLGMVYTIHIADPTAILAEEGIGDEPWPEEDTGTRLDRVFAPIGGLTWRDQPVTGPVVAARDVDNQPAGGLAEEYLGQYVYAPSLIVPDSPRRWIIAPAGPGDPTRWIADPLYIMPSNTDLGTRPGLLIRDPETDLVRLDLDPDQNRAAARGIVDACYVETGSWIRVKADTTNRVLLSGNYIEYETTANPEGTGSVEVTDRRPDEAPVTLRRDVSLRHTADATTLGRTLLPDDGVRDHWSLENVRWHLSRDPDALADPPALFPRHDLNGGGTGGTPQLRTACYHQIIALVGLPESQSPNTRRGWHLARLTGATLTITKGRITVDLTLLPGLPRPLPQTSGGPYHRWSTFSTRTDLATPTWADLDPADTWFDYRAARAS